MESLHLTDLGDELRWCGATTYGTRSVAANSPLRWCRTQTVRSAPHGVMHQGRVDQAVMVPHQDGAERPLQRLQPLVDRSAAIVLHRWVWRDIPADILLGQGDMVRWCSPR